MVSCWRGWFGSTGQAEMASSSEERPKDPLETELFREVPQHQWPIIYSPDYNLSVMGLEKLHPFDASKWGKVFKKLCDGAMVSQDTVIEPVEASQKDLLIVHTPRYLESLKSGITVAKITEVPAAAMLPGVVLERKLLRPMRLQTGGTVLGGKLAIDRGWAINIGGGFHHCSADHGGGFCLYADITMCIKFLFLRKLISKAMIIDLDAHQGNGHEHDFLNDKNVYILDVYNKAIYPHDEAAKKAIRRKVELRPYTEDEEYLEKVQTHVAGALNEFPPDLVVYNAGTDILVNDPLGCLSVSAEGIVMRDEIVFREVRKRNIPIVMVTSGGYQRETGPIIGESILNLQRNKLIEWTPAQGYKNGKK